MKAVLKKLSSKEDIRAAIERTYPFHGSQILDYDDSEDNDDSDSSTEQEEEDGESEEEEDDEAQPRDVKYFVELFEVYHPDSGDATRFNMPVLYEILKPHGIAEVFPTNDKFYQSTFKEEITKIKQFERANPHRGTTGGARYGKVNSGKRAFFGLRLREGEGEGEGQGQGDGE